MIIMSDDAQKFIMYLYATSQFGPPKFYLRNMPVDGGDVHKHFELKRRYELTGEQITVMDTLVTTYKGKIVERLLKKTDRIARQNL
jgi:hypothetical protein